MQKLIILTLFLGSQLLSAQTKNFIDQPYIETTSTDDTLISPDEIYLRIILSEMDTRGKDSVEDLETKMRLQLESLGVNLEEQLFVKDFSSNLRRIIIMKDDIWKSKIYSLLLYDAHTVEKVYRSFEQSGITNITVEKVAYSKMESLKLELLANAAKKARTKANSIVQSVGQELGKVLFVKEKVADTDLSRNRFEYLSSEVVGLGVHQIFKTQQKGDAIEFEKIKVSTQLLINFELL